MPVGEVTLTPFEPGTTYELFRVDPEDRFRPVRFAGLDDELDFYLSVGEFAFAGLPGKDQVYWTGEDAILDAVGSGEFDYVNPSWSHNEGDPQRQKIFELVRFDDRDFALRVANSCLVAAGREPRTPQ